MDPPEFLDAHDDSVLSDHPALLSRTDSLAAKRTFLCWPKRTLSFWDYSSLSRPREEVEEEIMQNWESEGKE